MKRNLEWKIIVPLTIIVLALDFSGVVDGIVALQWFKDHSASIVIAILIAILYFVIKILENTQESNQNIENNIYKSELAFREVVTNSLNAPFIKLFKSEHDFKSYYTNRVSQAKRKIDDLTWSHKTSASYHLRPSQLNEKKLEKEIDKVAGNIIYREIFIFNVDSRKNKLKNRLLENKEGYFCSYHNESVEIPRLQFVIIDDIEVIFTSNAFGVKMSVINPNIIKLMKSYFNLAWESSSCLKRGHDWHMENLKSILGDELENILQNSNKQDHINDISRIKSCAEV